VMLSSPVIKPGVAASPPCRERRDIAACRPDPINGLKPQWPSCFEKSAEKKHGEDGMLTTPGEARLSGWCPPSVEVVTKRALPGSVPRSSEWLEMSLPGQSLPSCIPASEAKFSVRPGSHRAE
jgi:hypothetical protein